MSHVECIGIRKSYGAQAIVEDLDLAIEDGEFLVLVGASGSGKTTTLKMINRLIEPSAGVIRFDGRDTQEFVPHELRRSIGYGAQRAGLLPHFSVARNVGITGKLLGWPKARIDARVDEMLDLVGLDPIQNRDRLPASLSGGEQQRVSLARALAAEPGLLLLDEPFGALDPVSRDQLQGALRDVANALSFTVVFVTHDMSEALLLADRIAFLEAGQIAQLGPPAALLQAPATEGVRDFLRAPRRQADRLASLFEGGAK